MNKLQLVKIKDEILNGKYQEYYEQYEGKVYVFLGEFQHASGHMLICEFGNGWNISGMHHIDEWEFLDKHPDDIEIIIPFDEAGFEAD